MKLKKILLVFILMLLFGTIGVNAKSKVKVYIFEAGGCPYCEAQVDYLKDLDGYNDTFEIIRKELYVDHVDWEKGSDYELGSKVAQEFTAKGFDNASIMGTPFVVVSDIYADTGYNTSLESIIDKAYKEGDKDAVGCIKRGNSNCVRSQDEVKDPTPSIDTTDNNDDIFKDVDSTEKSKTNGGVLAIVILSILLGISVICNIILLIVLSTKKEKEVIRVVPQVVTPEPVRKRKKKE